MDSSPDLQKCGHLDAALVNCLDVKPVPPSEWTPSQSQAAPSSQHVAPQRGFSVMWHQFSNIFASFCFVGGPVLCKGHLFSCVYFLNSVSSPPSYSSAIKINKHNDVLSSEGLSDRQKKKICKRLSAGAVNFLFDQLFARLPF